MIKIKRVKQAATILTLLVAIGVSTTMAEEKPRPEPTQVIQDKGIIEVSKRNVDIKQEEIEVASLRVKLTDEIENKKNEEEEMITEKLPDKEVAKLVFNGQYGNGEKRRKRLEAEGYDYDTIQKLVQEMTPVSRGDNKRKNKNTVNQSKSSTQIAKASAVGGRSIKAYPHKAFKSYMRWTALSKSSPQGRLCAKATKDPKTAIMMYEGRYLVALGFAYADYIGQKIDIVMESGQVIPVIVGDYKAREHTDQWNSATSHDGSIVEFIVSSNEEASRAVQGSGSYNKIFPGLVKEFIKR